MSDGTESAPVEFEFEQTIGVKFDARDLVRQLTPLQLVDLIREIDLEMDDWQATVLLSSYFSGQLREAPAELVSLSDEELEARLEAEDEVPAEKP